MTIRLEVIAGQSRTPFVFDQLEVTIGSDQDNDIVLPHVSVRPHHCSLEEDPGRGVEMDTSGTIQLVTDGEEVASARIRSFITIATSRPRPRSSSSPTSSHARAIARCA